MTRLLRRIAWALPFALLLAFAGLGEAHAQGTVRGFVTDATDGLPLQDVNVVLTEAREDRVGGPLKYGAVTDRDGFYALTQIPAGDYTIRFTFVGYERYEYAVKMEAGGLLALNVELQPTGEELGELVVEGARTGAARITAGQQSIRPADIERIPSPDVSGDLATFLSTLPGVVSTGDRGGNLFVRGGEPTQNLVLLDGIPIYQPFHLIGFYSAFPSDLVQRADLYAGGYGARFAGRLSSVLDVAVVNGNKKQFRASASASPFITGLQIDGPVVDDRASLVFSLRQSVVEEVASELVDQSLPYNFGEALGKVHLLLTEEAQLSVTALRSWDRGRLADFATEDAVAVAEADEVRYTSNAIGGRLLLVPDRLPLLAEILVHYASHRSELGSRSDPRQTSYVERIGGEAHMTQYLGDHEMTFGLFARTVEVDSRLAGLYQNFDGNQEWITEVGAYAEPSFHFGGLQVRPGLLVQTAFRGATKPLVEPRLRVVYERGRHALSGAAGVYHQQIVGLQDRRDAASVFTVWTGAEEARVPRATHVIAGYRARLPWGFEVAGEAYHKWLEGLSIGEWTAFPRFTTRLQPAKGTARGLDLRAELQRARYYFALTYGLAEVEYQAEQETLALWYGTERLRYNPPHDRRHQVGATAAVTLGALDLSARWQYGSGIPFTRAFGFDGFVLADGAIDVTREEGRRRVIYERPYNGRLPAYHRLDLAAAYTVAFSGADVALQASILNLYDRDNVFYYDVFTQRRVDQLPLIPSLGVKVTLR